LLRTSSTGGATPDIIALYIGQTECGLPHDLAHTEVSDPVPGTNRIAQTALKAPFKGVSTTGLDFVNYLFERG
jgi:hypothetical protein